MNDRRETARPSQRLAALLELHFDPRWGAPFWVEHATRLGLDPRREIHTVDELARLGPWPLEALATRPVTDFVPRRFHGNLRDFVTSETGGTTGAPKRTVFRRDEFDAAFVTPFVEAATLAGFPRERQWLFLGPSGPHVIGKAARACAAALGSMDPFSVDLDPRWVRRLPAGSLARERYLEHVLAQAGAVLESQEIGVLFATPPTLEALAPRLTDARREAIAGVHLGGVAAAPGFWERLAAWFPRAVALGGYGNSLAGVCPQLGPVLSDRPAYFPHGERLVLRVAEPGADGRGAVVFHRLDESTLLPGVRERDVAETASPPPEAHGRGFGGAGLRDPRPPDEAPGEQREGLY
jgi:hypothetical protein